MGIHLSENFCLHEFACPCCRSVGRGIDPKLVKLLQELRDAWGRITITSGYRCPKHNAEVGGSEHSQHMLGRAADIVVERMRDLDEVRVVRDMARDLGATGTKVVCRKPGHGWLHLDVRDEGVYNFEIIGT